MLRILTGERNRMSGDDQMPNQQVETRKKMCFVIAPIGQPDSKTRGRSDKVLKHVFERAMKPLGYQVLRADKISQPGLITVQVLTRLLEADLVIADLTEHNPNVFYELAVRHAASKPIIHVIGSGEQIPFDVSDFRTVKFDFTDLDSVESAIVDIQAQVSEIEAGHKVQTPVALAGLVMRLEKGDLQGKELLSELLNTLLQVRQDVVELKWSTQRLESARTYSIFGGQGIAGVGVPVGEGLFHFVGAGPGSAEPIIITAPPATGTIAAQSKTLSDEKPTARKPGSIARALAKIAEAPLGTAEQVVEPPGGNGEE